ncbi:hypothetical protein WJX73_003438 [Symbiochloris irregularis]|uniref:Ubiquitin-like domain-containing protein n=1 Tax=Symbiochloris irregularis TaxID=706552 RepID=A0AAW1P333_9CHLO
MASQTSQERVSDPTTAEQDLNIRVRTLAQTSHELRVPRTCTVEQLKGRLVATVHVPVERQRLIYRGRLLLDHERLTAAGVEDGHSLHLVERLPEQAAAAAQQPGSSTAQRQQQQRAGAPGNLGAADQPQQFQQHFAIGQVDFVGSGDPAQFGQVMDFVAQMMGMAANGAHAAMHPGDGAHQPTALPQGGRMLSPHPALLLAGALRQWDGSGAAGAQSLQDAPERPLSLSGYRDRFLDACRQVLHSDQIPPDLAHFLDTAASQPLPEGADTAGGVSLGLQAAINIMAEPPSGGQRPPNPPAGAASRQPPRYQPPPHRQAANTAAATAPQATPHSNPLSNAQLPAAGRPGGASVHRMHFQVGPEGIIARGAMPLNMPAPAEASAQGAAAAGGRRAANAGGQQSAQTAPAPSGSGQPARPGAHRPPTLADWPFRPEDVQSVARLGSLQLAQLLTSLTGTLVQHPLGELSRIAQHLTSVRDRPVDRQLRHLEQDAARASPLLLQAGAVLLELARFANAVNAAARGSPGALVYNAPAYMTLADRNVIELDLTPVAAALAQVLQACPELVAASRTSSQPAGSEQADGQGSAASSSQSPLRFPLGMLASDVLYITAAAILRMGPDIHSNVAAAPLTAQRAQDPLQRLLDSFQQLNADDGATNPASSSAVPARFGAVGSSEAGPVSAQETESGQQATELGEASATAPVTHTRPTPEPVREDPRRPDDARHLLPQLDLAGTSQASEASEPRPSNAEASASASSAGPSSSAASQSGPKGPPAGIRGLGGAPASPDLGAIMQQMMPMVSQMFGGGTMPQPNAAAAGSLPGHSRSSQVANSAASRGPMRSAGLSALGYLDADTAQHWRSTIMADRQGSHGRNPLSEAYRSGRPGRMPSDQLE